MPINYEAAKTLIKGLVQKMKTFRGNWNQNDPTADDYIKNRPFYSECLKRTIIPETTATINGYFIVEYYPIISFDIGQTYNVVWNGENYSCVAALLNGVVALGDFDFTKLPFLIAISESQFGGAYVAAIEEGEYTFSVTGITEQVHKIDKKFIDIPANLATTDEVGNMMDALYDNVMADVNGTVNNKMNATNPVGTGSFSMNRKAGTTVGNYSHAEGQENTASGKGSHAEGASTTASGSYSHAEGMDTTASGYCSHTEGHVTSASGNHSHAEGYFTAALSSKQHVQGQFNISDTENKYAHIVGNGDSENARSNAHTLDWSGNAWYSGDVYVGSTSGTNKDEGSKKLITLDDIPEVESQVFIVTYDSINDYDDLGEAIYNASREGKVVVFQDEDNFYDLTYSEIEPSHAATFTQVTSNGRISSIHIDYSEITTTRSPEILNTLIELNTAITEHYRAIDTLNAAIANKVTVPQDAVAGDLLTYDGTNWVRIPKADLIAEIIAALPDAEEASF